MSANADKKDSVYERQLAELETSLRRHENDESMLGEVGLAIRNLLAGNGESEAHIRQLLEREHDEGRLRPETYELVERLLAKIVAEQPADAADVASAGRAVDTVDFDPTVTDAVEAPPPVARGLIVDDDNIFITASRLDTYLERTVVFRSVGLQAVKIDRIALEIHSAV